MGQQELAVVLLPLLLISLPLAAREIVLPTKLLVWGYGVIAVVAAIMWAALCVGAIARAKEAFYQKHERSLLSKEYHNG